MTYEALIAIGISLALGLLVGLQRQRAGSEMGGVRTFPLIALLGAVCALLAQSHGGWVIAVGLAAVIALVVISNLSLIAAKRPEPGMTTEAAALLIYTVGAAAGSGRYAVALIIGGVTAVLLQSKVTLHDWVRRIGEDELRAIFRFVLIALVILPVLPNEGYGPMGMLNPFKTWLMVVLVVGIGLAAYVVQKLMGPRVGTLLAGVLGGLISSTATTMSVARRAHRSREETHRMTVMVMIASGMVFVRVLAEIAFVAPQKWTALMPPLAAMTGVMFAISAVGWVTADHRAAHPPGPGDSTSVKAAIGFGLVYALVMVAAAMARQEWGVGGLYAVAAISGLTDMDAVTLSTGELAAREAIDVATAWRVIMLASASNLVFKFGIVLLLGDASLKRTLAVPMTAAILAGAAILIFWPG
ncbi:MAG: DUF4010 domain-containing protein [Planctomycetes bacterium]|nr:DUF4010 domain-containing protein [Planctomycetota bacterium]